jgi:hypothetical protein
MARSVLPEAVGPIRQINRGFFDVTFTSATA